MLSDYKFITFELKGRVMVMTLNRPEKLNAVNGAMHEEITKGLREVARDADSSVIVLTGAGRAFCAGGDVSTMDSAEGFDSSRADPDAVSGEGLVDALIRIDKPVIAMVNGAAVGLGATIALLCDVVVAANDAMFADRHVNVGLVAGDGGAVIWPLLIGPARAKEFLMTGDAVSGVEAERIGLINHAVPREQLVDYTMQLADRLAALPQFAVRATKVAVNRIVRLAAYNVLDISGALESISMKREDHREAARAFVASRKRSSTSP